MSTHDGDPARRDDHESSGGACSIPIGVTSDGEIVRVHLRERCADLKQRYETFRANREPWKQAQSLAELGEVTARWLEGEFSYHPNGHSNGPDPETEEIAVPLAKLNRAGFVTENSQPGEPEEGPWPAQQASVFGYGDDETLARIRAACEGTDLAVIAHRTPKHPWPFRKRLDKGGPLVAQAGFGQLTKRTLALYLDGVGQSAWEDVLAAWQINVIDPEPGRKELLWDTLTTAIAPPCCPCNKETR